jgi:NADPH:quinone reductase-like Zn-dependent oxidoreductase
MKAFIIKGYSKNNALQLVDLPGPLIKENEILVQIHAAGVNQLDGKIKAGTFRLLLPYKFPLILGHDIAGTITKVGSKVRQFKIGDEVFARPADFHIGAFAEYIAVNEADAALKPKKITMEQAASLPLVALTAWQALVTKGHLQKEEKVFIQAGSGGVGTIAIQLAKHLGAIVATTTSVDNFDLVKSLGADIVIDYKSQDFETILKDYHVVLNSQDQNALEKSMRILKRGGKVISISGPPDPAFAKENRLSAFMKVAIFFLSRKVKRRAKKLEVDYSFLFMKASGKQLSEISRLVEAGVIRPVIDKTFPFEKTNEAMAYVDGGKAKGKVVVTIKKSAG